MTTKASGSIGWGRRRPAERGWDPPAKVVLCHPVRTPIGEYNGSLKGMPAPELGAIVVKETVARAAADPGMVDAIVRGQCPLKRQSIEPRPPGSHSRRSACVGAGHEGQPHVRLRRTSYRRRRTGDLDR